MVRSLIFDIILYRFNVYFEFSHSSKYGLEKFSEIIIIILPVSFCPIPFVNIRVTCVTIRSTLM